MHRSNKRFVVDVFTAGKGQRSGRREMFQATGRPALGDAEDPLMSLVRVSLVRARRRCLLGWCHLLISGVPCSSADAALLFLRRRYLYWDATDDEMAMALPGDELLRRADLTATGQSRFAAPLRVSGHGLAQLGQGRGGFYSYDFLENLVGCDIHSADRIVPEWQSINVGGEVNLYPGVGLLVAHVEAIVLREKPDRTTRLIVRERYESSRRWSSLLVENHEPEMLHGIRDRATRTSPRLAGRGLPG